MERLLQDLRFGVRLLWKDRGFAATALLTLAICIGANAAIFAVVYSVLLRPLPVPDADRLVLMYNRYPRAGVERSSNGVPDYYDRLRELDVFDEQALYNTRGLTLGLEGDPQRIAAMVARPSLLRMLRARPVRGRLFTEEEGEHGNDRKAILTYSLWQQLHGGRETAIGASVRLNGELYTVVGILPDDFEFIDPEVRIWLPLSFTAAERSDDARHSNNWSMVGRLKPGATVSQAQQQLNALNARNLERFPHLREILTNAGFHTVATPLQDDLVRGVSDTLYLLWGGVLFVLLIGAVNITNLVLVRSSARAKELATRHALGAALGRLARQLLTETILLTIAGGLVGVLLGYLGLTLLATLGIENIPRAHEIRMDGAVVAFTMALALCVGVAVGLVPVIQLRSTSLTQAFREESRSGTSGRTTRLVRRTLVASQVALALMLLIAAGLLLASFQRVLAIDPGFETTGVLTARVSPPPSRYPDSSHLRAVGGRLLERVRSLPGVVGAGITSSIPLGGNFDDSVIIAEGYRMAPGESLISPYRMSVSPGYFEAMGMRMVSGRAFNDGDSESAPAVVIVDEKLARRFWPEQSPIGRRMFQPDDAQDLLKPGPKARWYTVVGVVSEVRIASLTDTADRPGVYYFPIAQQPRRNFTLTVRTAGDPAALTNSIRRELTAIDAELPLFGVMTMAERVRETLLDRRTPMVLALGFACIAIFLASIGIYGVLAYGVSQRTREIGIRMALGSDASGIFRLVIAEGLALLAIGFAFGIAGAFVLRRAIATQLYGVGPMDPRVLTSVALLLGIVALVACVVPARRAAGIDPTTALTRV